MPLCSCKKAAFKANCHASIDCAIWHNGSAEELYCLRCSINNCQVSRGLPANTSAYSNSLMKFPPTTADRCENWVMVGHVYTEGVGDVNLLNLYTDRLDWGAYQYYVNMLGDIVMGKTTTSRVIESLEQMEEEEAKEKRARENGKGDP